MRKISWGSFFVGVALVLVLQMVLAKRKSAA